MAKISDPRNKSGDTPRVRGAFLTLAGKDKWHVQAWPKKRGKSKTPGDYYNRQKFALLGRMAANAIAEDVLTATEMTRGTQQVPRDFIQWCIQGQGYELVNEDGFVWPVRATMTTNPQYVLDDVTNIEGSMLWRSPVGWIGLERGTTGQMLWQGEDGPEWANPPGSETARPKITTLTRTSDMATTSAAIHECTWQSALLDENAAWDPANPTRLNIPPTATRIRLSATLIWTGIVATQIYDVVTRANDGIQNFQGALRNQLQRVNTSASDRQMQVIGPWVPHPGKTWVALRYTQPVNETTGFKAGSMFTLECCY